jgi:hypothetical protein
MGSISSRNWIIAVDAPHDMVHNTLDAVTQIVHELAGSPNKGYVISINVKLENTTRNQPRHTYANELQRSVERYAGTSLVVGYNELEFNFHLDTYKWRNKHLYLTGKEKLALFNLFIERRHIGIVAEDRLLNKRLRRKFGEDFPTIL